MKANELMFGDLVLVADGQQMNVRKVASITRKKIGYHKEDGETRMWHAPLCSVKPIPITEAIIEAAEFIYNEEWNKGCYAYDANKLDLAWSMGFHFLRGEKQFHSSGKKGTLSFWQCEYVHELQHALRLCGYNELADNFKVSPKP